MIFLILLIGFLLRLVNINQSLWLDEAISTLAARDLTYYGIAFEFLKIDNHPPLFYLLLKLWGQIFSFSDWALRILPIILGTAIALIAYRITLKISNDKKVSQISALLISTSPLLVYYSQEIRMYILITLLATIQLLIFQNILEKQHLWKWLAFSLLNCLLFFSDYVTIFLFPVFLIYALIIKNKNLFLKIILTFIPLGVLFILWWPVFNAQLIKNNEIVNSFPGWQYIVGGATLKNLIVFWMKIVMGRISFEPKLVYYSLVTLATIPILICLIPIIKKFKKHLLLWLYFLIPVITGFAFSFIIPAFNYFRFIYVVPALLILVTLGIFSYKKKLKIILISGIIMSNLVGLAIYYTDPNQQRENWKQAVEYIESTADSQSLVIFEFYEPIAPFRWYTNNKIEVLGATDSYFADPIKTPQKMAGLLQNKNKVYYFEYLRDLTDPKRIVEKTLEAEGFVKGKVLNDFKNIGQLTIWTR